MLCAVNCAHIFTRNTCMVSVYFILSLKFYKQRYYFQPFFFFPAVAVLFRLKDAHLFQCLLICAVFCTGHLLLHFLIFGGVGCFWKDLNDLCFIAIFFVMPCCAFAVIIQYLMKVVTRNLLELLKYLLRQLAFQMWRGLSSVVHGEKTLKITPFFLLVPDRLPKSKEVLSSV